MEKSRRTLPAKALVLESKIPIIWGRLILLNSVLSSLPMFMMSFFEVPKGVLKNLDHFGSRFFGKVLLLSTI
jgi:hypothetical protein